MQQITGGPWVTAQVTKKNGGSLTLSHNHLGPSRSKGGVSPQVRCRRFWWWHLDGPAFVEIRIYYDLIMHDPILDECAWAKDYDVKKLPTILELLIEGKRNKSIYKIGRLHGDLNNWPASCINQYDRSITGQQQNWNLLHITELRNLSFQNQKKLHCWWFQPIWNIWYRKIGSFPQVGVKIKHIWVATT